MATVVAGGALAAAAHSALAEASLPSWSAADVLPLSADGLLAPATEPVVELVPSVGLVAGEPVVTDAGDLVKAADLARAAAEAAAAEQARAEAARAEAARAEEARLEQERRRAADLAPAGGVEMLTGRVTSGFGARWGSLHQGLDIAAPIGTPIRVPLSGTVIDSGPASGFGLWVRVRHDDGTVTVYGHINRALVNVGDAVAAGEVIAEVGNRGQSTGPHLHFEVVTPAGQKINPRPWLDERGIGY